MAERAYCVYKLTSPSGKAYIGQTNDFSRRCVEHKKPTSGSWALVNAIKKYGWESFTHEFLKEGLTIDEANYYEQFYIQELKTLSPDGYNLTSGGANAKLTEEVKSKISLAHKGIPLTEEHKAALAKARVGRKLSETHKQNIAKRNIGRKMPKESVEKTRLAHVGKIVSEETRKKISFANTGKKHSEESKRLRSLRQMGEGNPNYGKLLSDTQKQAISEANKARTFPHPMLGKRHTEESKTKMRLAQQVRFSQSPGTRLGKKATDESRKKMSESAKEAWRKKNRSAVNG